MKHTIYKRLPLAVAVLGVLASQAALAHTDNESVVKLDKLSVTVDRQGTKVKTNVVNLKEKDESTATDLRGLLKDEPSIDFGSGNGTSQYITIRGMGQNSIDVKVDDAYSDSQILYHQGRHMLDPSLVKIVSVQKGAGSASAGIGATNGAIVAKTLDAHDLLTDDKNYGFKLNAGYSSNNEHSYGVSAFGKHDNFDLLLVGNRVVQGDYQAGGGYKSPVDGGNKVRYQALDKVSYLAKAGVNLGDHRFVLSHLKEENKGVRNIREEFDWYDKQDPKYRKISTQTTNLEWNAKNLGFVDEAKANAYVMDSTRISADDTQSGYAGKLAGQNRTQTKAKGVNFNFDSQVNDNVLLKYGVNYRYQTAIPNKLETGIVNQEKTDSAIYVEAIADIGHDITATTGLRYDNFKFKAMQGKQVSDGSLNPSIGLIWQATPTLSFNTNHSYATRSPRFYDALTAHGRRAIVGVADGIKAERAKNTEIGFNYKLGSFFANGSYYWQDIDNLLNSASGCKHKDASATPTECIIQNSGYAKNQGYELNAGYQHQGLTARLGVSESSPKFYSKDKKLKFDSRDYAARLGRTWTANVSYRFNTPALEVGLRHRLTEKALGQSAWVGTSSDTVVKDPKGYQVTDIYANWKPYDDKLNVNFAVNNVANTLYKPHLNNDNRALPAVGREFRVGVNFTY